MMTTPERFRRRQIIEGIVLMLLAIFIVVQSIAFNVDRHDQQQCLQESFTELNHALETRSILGARETAATRSVLDAFARAAEHPAQNNRSELIRVLVNYKKEIEEVTLARKQHPVPPYPVGKCG